MMEQNSKVKWQSSAFFASKRLPADELAAYMGELAISRNSGILHAEGGPCPIVAVYRPDAHLGALLHVDGGDAEMDGNNHEELIDALLDIEGDIVQNAICHVFLDELPLPGMHVEAIEAAAQIEDRKAYADRIRAYLESNGISNVSLVFNGVGKDVELNTETGILTSTDDEDVSFSHDYNVPPHALA